MIAYFLPFFKSFYWFASFAFDKHYLPLVNASKAALNYFRVHITEMIALEVEVEVPWKPWKCKKLDIFSTFWSTN